VNTRKQSQLGGLKKWQLKESENGGYSLYKTFQFFLSFNKARRLDYEGGRKEYTFYDKRGYNKLTMFSGFLPKYICKEIDKIVEVK